jgi:hypothetical protein
MFGELTIIKSIGIKNLYFISLFYLIVISYAINFKTKFKIHKNYFILSIISFFISFNYITLYLDNPAISYLPTTKQSFYSPLFYSLIYSINAILFYKLSEKFFEKKFLIFLSTLLFISSPFQLYFLGPSLLRDYIKVTCLLIFLINILTLLNVKKSENFFKIVIIISSVTSLSLLFRQDLLTFIPITIFTIFFTNINIEKKIIGILLYLIFLFPILNEIINLGNASGILSIITTLGSDLDIIYNYESSKSFGPFDDYYHLLPACFFYECNQFKLFIFYAMSNLDFILIRFLYCLLEIIKIPFQYNFFPHEDGIFYLLNLKGKFLEYCKYLLPLLLFDFIFDLKFYKKNYKSFLLFIILLIYFTAIVSLQFFGKNFFHLEIFSITIFIFTIKRLFNYVRILCKN